MTLFYMFLLFITAVLLYHKGKTSPEILNKSKYEQREQQLLQQINEPLENHVAADDYRALFRIVSFGFAVIEGVYYVTSCQICIQQGWYFGYLIPLCGIKIITMFIRQMKILKIDPINCNQKKESYRRLPLLFFTLVDFSYYISVIAVLAYDIIQA